MKTHNEVDMTQKSTKNIQMAGSGDNLPSTMGTNNNYTQAPWWLQGPWVQEAPSGGCCGLSPAFGATGGRVAAS